MQENNKFATIIITKIEKYKMINQDNIKFAKNLFLTPQVSVTAVVHGKQESQLARPAFLYKEGLTGAERGTATHAFLQAADFALAALDLEAEIRRQIEEICDDTL